MARIRTVKPDFWKHEELSELPEVVHMFAAALLNYSDDEGFFNANPKLIKAELFPLREPSMNVHGMLSELSKIGYIKLYKGTDGKTYGHVVNFLEHQRVNRPQASKYKALIDFTEGSVNAHELFTAGKEGKGKERKGRDNMSGKPDGMVKAECEKVLTHLNQKANRNYQPVEANIKLIQARSKEGYTFDDLLSVIDRKCSEWLTNPKMKKYLRPATLFDKTKFSQYFGEVGSPQEKTDQDEIDDWLNEEEGQGDFIDGEFAEVALG